MRVIKIYCDRCGKEFEKWNYKGKEAIGIAEFVYDDGDPYLDYQKDLCESCYTELEKWWLSGKNTEVDAPKKRKGIPLEENESGYNCENWIP